jgi:group I intron endonuclease
MATVIIGIDTTNMQGIYSITNKVNGKVYIGQDTNMPSRWNNYHKPALRKGVHTNPILQKAWKKYGEDMFIYGALLCGPFSKEDLTELEQVNIDNYKTLGLSYNILPANCSRAGMKNSQEHNEKISVALKGNIRAKGSKSNLGQTWTLSEEYRKNRARKLLGNKNSLGFIPSAETRKKLSEAKRGSNHPMFGKHLTETHKKNISLGRLKCLSLI